MHKKINVRTFSSSEFRKAAEEIRKYNDELVYKTKLLAEKLSETGVEIAMVQISTLDAIFTGELIESLNSEYKSSTPCGAIFVVKASSKHAIYVELGTGIIGSKSPYPVTPPVNWNYSSGKTIHYTSNGRYGWFYPSDDGKWYFTEGMPSRPFMHNTSMELYKKVEKIAREVFR